MHKPDLRAFLTDSDSWEAIWLDRSLFDKVFLSLDFDRYVPKDHKNHQAQVGIALYSSVFN